MICLNYINVFKLVVTHSPYLPHFASVIFDEHPYSLIHVCTRTEQVCLYLCVFIKKRSKVEIIYILWSIVHPFK